jgi:hypothetical protein
MSDREDDISEYQEGDQLSVFKLLFPNINAFS